MTPTPQLSEAIREKIDAVLRTAHAAGRRTLYEHEVYQILACLGLDVPRVAVIKDPGEVNAALLRPFGHRVVAKIISSNISHKARYGGVRTLRTDDPLYVELALRRMAETVTDRFPGPSPPAIDGFLLVEYIPHTQALGYEVLLGFSEDIAFGPVLTLSKGGDDAEFFAEHYDPANLFLPPLDPAAARAGVRGLKIRHKFEAIGRGEEYLTHLTETASLLSRLAWHYSFIADPRPDRIITALDVNPFVLSEDGRFVAVDGFARITPVTDETATVPPPRLDGLDGFFAPDGIAVVGVSADPAKHSLGRNIAQLLHDMGRTDLFFINPKGGNIDFDGTGYPLHRSMADLPRPVDLAVYAAPARHTVAFFESLSDPPPRAVILISGLPADLDSATFARAVVAANPGSRIIGPNCMGVYSAPGPGNPGLNTLFIEETRLDLRHSETSNTVLLTQSGAFSVTAIDRFQRSRLFRSVVSFGNKYDVTVTDLMAYFADQPGIDVIALYVEGLDPGEGRGFFELAGRIDKPIIVYKAGRTDAGAKVTASHTASMSGAYDVFKAACDQAGVILAAHIEDHYHWVKAFSLLSRKLPVSRRVAGVVNAGFESAAGADEMTHLTPAWLSEATVTRLREIDRTGLVDVRSSFLDVTPMADDRDYADFVETMLQDPGVGCLFVSVVPHTETLKTAPDTCHDPDALAPRLVDLSRRYPQPMVISVNAGRYYADLVGILEENGLPVYPDIRSAVTSLDRFVAYHLARKRRPGRH